MYKYLVRGVQKMYLYKICTRNIQGINIHLETLSALDSIWWLNSSFSRAEATKNKLNRLAVGTSYNYGPRKHDSSMSWQWYFYWLPKCIWNADKSTLVVIIKSVPWPHPSTYGQYFVRTAQVHRYPRQLEKQSSASSPSQWFMAAPTMSSIILVARITSVIAWRWTSPGKASKCCLFQPNWDRVKVYKNFQNCEMYK